MNQILESQQTPHISPSWASYGLSVVRIWEKTDHVLTAPHCNKKIRFSAIFKSFYHFSQRSWLQTLSQSPCTTLTADVCLPLGPCKGAVSGLSRVASKNGGNSHWSHDHEPTVHHSWGNPNLYLGQSVTKGWCQPIGGHVSYPTDSPTTTRQWLCSSLKLTQILIYFWWLGAFLSWWPPSTMWAGPLIFL